MLGRASPAEQTAARKSREKERMARMANVAIT
jgi:hypothetical protein